ANGNSESKTYTKCTSGTGSRTMYGNGNHNLSIADVDGDGCDEIIWGSAALNNDGWLLYATGYGHGDAIHLSDLVPQRPGLEVFQVHEESPYGWDLHDAATGEIIYSAISDGDNGRGMAADIEVDYEGCEFWSAAKDGTHAVTNGSAIYAGQGATNFRIYWDGDLQEELFDGNYSTTNGGCTPKVTKMSNGVASEIARLTATSARTCNTTKATPCLQADIFGDWREEVLLWNGEDPSQIFIFAANSETTYRIPTLMHDHVYRMGVAWQNVAYNQPPHLGYYLPASFTTRYALMGEGAMEQTVNVGDSIKTIVLKWVNCAAPSLTKWTDPTGTSKVTGSPEGFTLVRDIYLNKTITLTGAPTMAGDYEFILKSGKNIIDETQQYDTIRIHAISTDGIDGVKTNANPEEWVKLGKSSFNNSIVLTFNLNEAQDVKIGLYSMAGAQVADVTHLAVNQAPFEIYGLNRLPAGIYLLKVESKEGKFTQKLLKR
ncbi:MAG: T9SS type A sorting domain-containing protein, partial [Prevotella sp.]